VIDELPYLLTHSPELPSVVQELHDEARDGSYPGQLSVDVTSGQQSLVFVYGTSLTDLHLAVGPIQP
jgi:hypothetical protein